MLARRAGRAGWVTGEGLRRARWPLPNSPGDAEHSTENTAALAYLWVVAGGGQDLLAGPPRTIPKRPTTVRGTPVHTPNVPKLEQLLNIPLTSTEAATIAMTAPG